MYWMGGLFSTYHSIRGVNEGLFASRENYAQVIATNQPPVSDGAILLRRVKIFSGTGTMLLRPCVCEVCYSKLFPVVNASSFNLVFIPVPSTGLEHRCNALIEVNHTRRLQRETGS